MGDFAGGQELELRWVLPTASTFTVTRSAHDWDQTRTSTAEQRADASFGPASQFQASFKTRSMPGR